MFREKLQNLKLTVGNFQICPGLQHPDWKKVPQELREAIIDLGRNEMEKNWSLILATDYLDFSRTGTRKRFEDIYFARRIRINNLVLYYIMLRTGSTNDAALCAKVLDEIVNGIMLLCEESGWQLPAHNSYVINESIMAIPNTSKPIIDLFSSETGALLACIYALLKTDIDAISEEIGLRIERELQFRIVQPFLYEHFGWMGGKDSDEPIWNWTAWCVQNVLLVFFSLKLTEEEKILAIHKAAFSIDWFLAHYGEDGACCDGVQYYKHSGLCLYNIIEMINSVTGGSLKSIYQEKKIKNIAEFPYYMQIKDAVFFNFADCSPLALNAGVREYEFGKRIRSSYLCSLALQHIKLAPLETKILKKELNLFFRLQSLFSIGKLLSAEEPKLTKIKKEKYYESCGLFVKSDLHFQTAIKAGNNGGEHSHNDIGNFIIYKDGKSIFIDIGVETYSAKTFSSSRYDIWTMQSAWHNLPTFCLEMQKAGKKYSARDVKYRFGKNPYISMDIAGAYKESAGVKSYIRRLSYTGDEKIRIHDTFVPESASSSEIQYPVLSLITEASPVIKETNGALHMELNGAFISIQCLPQERNLYFVENISINDYLLQQAWAESIYRILLPFKEEIIIEIT